MATLVVSFRRKMPHSFTYFPVVPLATQMWDGEEPGNGTLYGVPGLGRSTAMEKDHSKGSPAQSRSSAHSLFLWGCCRCQHVQAGACSVQMESLKYLADKLLNVFTKLVLIENFQRFIAWPNVGGFSKRWQKAHPQEQGHPFSKCYASVPKHILLN